VRIFKPSLNRKSQAPNAMKGLKNNPPAHFTLSNAPVLENNRDLNTSLAAPQGSVLELNLEAVPV
jgi:hypothetical protein